jgi:hypothetical protein
MFNFKNQIKVWDMGNIIIIFTLKIILNLSKYLCNIRM